MVHPEAAVIGASGKFRGIGHRRSSVSLIGRALLGHHGKFSIDDFSRYSSMLALLNAANDAV